MFLDASVIVAILAREPDAEVYKKAIDRVKAPLFLSPLTVFEAAVSLARAKLGPRPKRNATGDEIRAALAVVLAFVEANDIKEILVTPDISRRAVEAAATFGRAVGHPADLNFGDCFSYASARAYRSALLFKGNDFSQTDIEAGAGE